MRAWFSVPIVRGIRTGVSVNANPAARIYRVSATGRKVWYIGSTVMSAGSVDAAVKRQVEFRHIVNQAKLFETDPPLKGITPIGGRPCSEGKGRDSGALAKTRQSRFLHVP
jgi:hypothetical protein